MKKMLAAPKAQCITKQYQLNAQNITIIRPITQNNAHDPNLYSSEYPQSQNILKYYKSSSTPTGKHLVSNNPKKLPSHPKQGIFKQLFKQAHYLSNLTYIRVSYL